jgi:hypothetical protein
MQDLQALQRPPMIEGWRERLPTMIALALGLLLAAALLALILTIVNSPDRARREPDIIQLLLVRPAPEPPPKPAEQTVQPALRPRDLPPVRVQPRKPVEQHRNAAALAPAPKLKPAPPQPKTRSTPVADPLSVDEPPDWRQYALPKGANAGTVIGGNGDNGGGSGCGGSVFLPMVTSQIHSLVQAKEMDDRAFHVQADIWFDDLGMVQRSQLLQSTGKADLDASIRTMLGKINVGPGVPQCIQPITVWINHPDDGTNAAASRKNAAPAGAHVESWQTRHIQYGN